MEEEDKLFGEDVMNGEEAALFCGEVIYEGKTLPLLKEKETDKVFWVEDIDTIGSLLVSFDGVKVYNLFADYPHNMSKTEKEIFDKENPYWADFFKWRTK